MSDRVESNIQKLLSFVTDADGGRVFIHADKNGLDLLIKELTWLKQKLEAGECEHSHLRSSEWAGDELTTSKLNDQEGEVHIVHGVKIYGWNDEWKKKHGLVMVASYGELVSALRRDAELHRAGRLSEMGSDFDVIDASVKIGDRLRGIPLKFWDAWLDERNHSFPGLYKGISKADWPELADIIATSIETNVSIKEPKILNAFGPKLK